MEESRTSSKLLKILYFATFGFAFILGYFFLWIMKMVKPEEVQNDVRPLRVSKSGSSRVILRTNKVISKKSDKDKQILELLNRKKTVGIADVMVLFPNRTVRTIQRYMDSLEERGLVEQHGNTRSTVYSLPKN